MDDRPSRPTRIFVALSLVGLAVMLADIPARIATALGAEDAKDLAAGRERCAAELTEALERSELNHCLVIGLIEGHDTLPESAALMASTRLPDSTAADGTGAGSVSPTEEAAGDLIRSVANWMDTPSPRRRAVLGRLLRDYRKAFGKCPPRLAPIERAVQDPSAAVSVW